MTIGGSIALIVIGAILRFAINWSPTFVNLRLVGVILMVGGGIGLIISLALLTSRRRRLPVGQSTEVYEQRRYTEPPVSRTAEVYEQRRYTEPPVSRSAEVYEQRRYTDPPV